MKCFEDMNLSSFASSSSLQLAFVLESTPWCWSNKGNSSKWTYHNLGLSFVMAKVDAKIEAQTRPSDQNPGVPLKEWKLQAQKVSASLKLTPMLCQFCRRNEASNCGEVFSSFPSGEKHNQSFRFLQITRPKKWNVFGFGQWITQVLEHPKIFADLKNFEEDWQNSKIWLPFRIKKRSQKLIMKKNFLALKYLWAFSRLQ